MSTRVISDQWARWGRRIGVLVLSSIPLWFIYSNPPLELRGEGPDPKTLSSALPYGSENNAAKLLMAEHTKVTDEIKMRIEEENELFRYKFALLGGLLLAFLIHIARSDAKENTDGPDERIAKLMNSCATCVVLALAFAIAVTIDLHIRTATVVINQFALWIRHYVEPAFLQDPLVGYEGYLRPKPLAHGGMGNDYIYGFMYWPPLHFMTWVIYLVYLIVLQNVCLHRGRWRELILASFALVHFSLAAFAWMGHTAPSTFQFKIFGWPVSGLKCGPLYLLPWLFLLVINSSYVKLLFSSADTESESSQTSAVHLPQEGHGARA
jgi:hypothetical protein